MNLIPARVGALHVTAAVLTNWCGLVKNHLSAGSQS